MMPGAVDALPAMDVPPARRGPATASPVPHSRPWITEADRAAVAAVLAEGMLAEGRRSGALAAALADRAGHRFGRVLPSGTAALEAAVRALGVRAGGEVIVPTYVCGEVARAVQQAGARVRFADVDAHGVLTAAHVEAVSGPRTAAVVVVHLYGQPADSAAIRRLGWPVIDDACQALGLPLPDADCIVTSLHATKCLTAGEGGHVAVSDPALDARLRSIAGAPLADLNAALALSQLARYDVMLERRARIAERLLATAAALGLQPVIRAGLPMPPFRVVVRSPDGFPRAAAGLGRAGVTARRGVDALLHRAAGLPDAAFPGATALFAQAVSLPAHASLEDAELDRVVSAMHETWSAVA